MGNFLAKIFCMGWEESDDIEYDYEEHQARLYPYVNKLPSCDALSEFSIHSDEDYSRQCFWFYDPEREHSPIKQPNSFMDYPDSEFY